MSEITAAFEEAGRRGPRRLDVALVPTRAEAGSAVRVGRISIFVG